MKEAITKEIGKEIAEKKKLPKEVKDNMNKQVVRNLLFASFIVLYFIFLNLGYLNIEKSIFIQDTAVFAMACLIISIVLFEKAYRKEKGFLAIHGIEILIVALLTLFTPYTYFYLQPLVSKILMIVPVIFAMYYVAKGIIICIKTQKVQDKNISDVKEIVKKEKRNFDEAIFMDKDKEAEMLEPTLDKKVKKEEKVKNEKIKKEKKTKEPKAEKKATKKTESKKEETKPKKTTTRTTKVKKEEKEEKEEYKEKETTSKKKTETTKKKTATVKKETTEGTKTRKPRVKKEE